MQMAWQKSTFYCGYSQILFHLLNSIKPGCGQQKVVRHMLLSGDSANPTSVVDRDYSLFLQIGA